MSAASLVMSLYLAYILAFVLVDLCLVCLATYTVNIGLAVPAFENYFSAMAQQRKNLAKKD
jgi:vitamin-K-epoxide reductase (warfarin-sensitive)